MRSILRPALLLTAVAPLALAHPGHDVAGLAAGLNHPLAGLDHLLAMVAVGLLAARSGDRQALWALPASFMGAMLIGSLLATTGLHLPLVEGAIAASVMVLGLMLAVATAPRLGWSCLIVALCALLHGYAHVIEATGALVPYVGGMLLTTALLHAAGLVAALGMIRLRSLQTLRLTGAAIACAGVVLLAV